MWQKFFLQKRKKITENKKKILTRKKYGSIISHASRRKRKLYKFYFLRRNTQVGRRGAPAKGIGR